MISDSVIHFGSVGLLASLAALGAGLGQGIASRSSFEAITRQPAAQEDITRTFIISLALIETASIIGAITAILLFLAPKPTYYGYLGSIGVLFAVAIPAFVIGIAASFPARAAFTAIARQPFFSKKITNVMVITQSILQTPLIFGFIIAIFIRSQLNETVTMAQGLKLLASGICVGLGTLGPTLGLSKFAGIAVASTGVNRKAYGRILSFSFFSQAIIETPALFALIISLLIYSLTLAPDAPISIGLIILAVALSMGIGTFGPGLSLGKIAEAAVQELAFKPEHYSLLSRISTVTQGFIDTSAIYVLLTALLILFSL